MADDSKPGVPGTEAKALDGISVAPPVPDASDADVGAPADPGDGEETPAIREAVDAQDNAALKADPSDPDAKLDVALDETFPTSDAPSMTRPGAGSEPAPSSGYDETAEGHR